MGVAGRRHPADGRGEHGVTDALKHAGLVLHSCRRGGIARLQQQGPTSLRTQFLGWLQLISTVQPSLLPLH